MLFLNSCKSEEFKKQNKPFLERQEGFNTENNSFGVFECPYEIKDLELLINSNEKVAWPKIRVTATFGGFNIPNNPCSGCENCGCCFGLCIQSGGKSSLAYTDLSDDEIKDKEVLFDFVDEPDDDQIILIPMSNIDNGDGYFHVEENTTFTDRVNDFIGRNIRLSQGSYEIKYLEGFDYGIVVIRTL